MSVVKNTSRGSAASGLIPVGKQRLELGSLSVQADTFFLRTSRLGFRKWSEQDIPLAIGLWGDPAVTKFIDARRRLSNKDVKRVLQDQIETQREYGVQCWPIFLTSTCEPVGCCGLRPYDPANAIFEIGVHLHPAFRGRGLAEEAAAAVMEYAFCKLGASALFASHHPGNIAARHLINRLGFQFTHTQHFPSTGLDHPSYMRTRGMVPLRFRQPTAVSA